MDSIKEEHWARRAEEQAQWHVVIPENYYLSALFQNIPLAPVWNRERGRERFHMTPIHVPQNLENAIYDLHRHWLVEQQQRMTQEYRAQVIRVEGERQREVDKVEINQTVEVNQIIEEWRNKDVDALDYEGQQILENREDNEDLHVNRNIQENLLRAISDIFE